MNLIKKIILLPYNIFKVFWKGFYFLVSKTTLGFYSYFLWFFQLFKVFFSKSKILNSIINHFEKRKRQPEAFLFTIFCIVTVLSIYNFLVNNVSFTRTFIKNDKQVVENNDSNDIVATGGDLYKEFENYSLSKININNLKNTNSDTVAWLIVNNTNINYPIVKTNDNIYYLDHYFDKSINEHGWVFMDYRNNYSDLSTNTIIYGKELDNKESFGNISYLYSDDYFINSNKSIMLITDKMTYNYKVFSIYTTNDISHIQPEYNNYYEYLNFLNLIKNASVRNFEDVVGINDKILTLVTIGSNNEAKVIHAKLIL